MYSGIVLILTPNVRRIQLLKLLLKPIQRQASHQNSSLWSDQMRDLCKLCLQEKLSILRSAPSLNKRSEILDNVSIGKKKSCLGILASPCQPMRSPCRPKLRVLTKVFSAKYFQQFILKLHIVEHSFSLCCCK